MWGGNMNNHSGVLHNSNTGRESGEIYNGGDACQASGTSIFDPVLCELIYLWFTPYKGSYILDPFAGGSVRGIVAAYLEHNYIGIDLSENQIAANRLNAQEVLKDIQPPVWICDDSENLEHYTKDIEFDLIFSCPPYFDLEIYSDDNRDLSNMQYDKFIEKYRNIISKSIGKLKDNRFACFVVSDIRDRKGFYRNFPATTIDAFQDAGAILYNEAILVNVAGSLPIRVGKQFARYRKLGRLHQKVLIFYKGDPKTIKQEFNEIEITEIEMDEH